MSLSPERLSSLLRVALWFAAIAGAVALLVFTVASLSRQMRIEQAQRELAQLQRMLEQFKARHGDYPAVMGGVPLLRCLLGRADARGQPFEKPQPWFMTGAQLYFRLSDPTAPGNEIVDPWGRPYVYHYLFARDPEPAGYLLVSGGPDRRHSEPLFWSSGANGTAPEDADNLWVNSRTSAAVR